MKRRPAETVVISQSGTIEALTEALESFLQGSEEDCWIVDDSVDFCGSEEAFLNAFATCKADFLATHLRTVDEDPHWPHWKTLRPPPENHNQPTASPLVAAQLRLLRLSRKAARLILDQLALGWKGHADVLLPTLSKMAGLVIEDIGGDGSFTPPLRKGRWYDERSWNMERSVEYVPGKLHYPAPSRILSSTCLRLDELDIPPKLLYVSPVGASAREILPSTLAAFRGAGADCLLLQYDDSRLDFPDGIQVIREAGQKWELARLHLRPEQVEAYDYIFFWDDDIDAKGFDPARFARIMHMNRLGWAQPAILSPYPVSHPITSRQPCPPPWKTDDDTRHMVVGRLTNFVEIMVPVYTRDTWRQLHAYLDPANGSGWGYDFIPLGRKGIVDALPVIHTRPVQSTNSMALADLERFLSRQGLFHYQVGNQGLLFE